jgi:hypothetical protein
MNATIPVVLFAYNRPRHLSQTLEALKANKVPLIYALSDGPRTPEFAPAVAMVRETLRSVKWCELVLVEREENRGIGRSIRDEVTRLLGEHAMLIVFEDDVVCVPGTYEYLCAALRHYRDDSSVMSVTGWTHERVTPGDVHTQPYFDGRAECWAWGTWARAWKGMDSDALTLMHQCEAQGLDIYRYGADLPSMAQAEARKNIWAVRWLYLHILRQGLCLRPPRSLVEHIGFDALATNAANVTGWTNAPLQPCPPLPEQWPTAQEHPGCARLWRVAYGGRPSRMAQTSQRIRRMIGKAARRVGLRPLKPPSRLQ